MFRLKFSKTMKDVQLSFISLATASLSHLLLRILLGRELGPSGLGVYTLVFTIYMFGLQFAAFGIGSALTKYVAQFSDNLAKTKEYISSGMVGSVITGTLMAAALFILSGTISINFFNIPEMVDLLKITSICFPFIAIYKAVTGTFNGFRSMKAFAVLNIALNALVLFISAFLVLFLNMGVVGGVVGFVIPTIIIGSISVVFVRSYLVLPEMSILQNDIFKDILSFGFYVVLANSIGYIYGQIDSLMIGYYMDESQVGFYAVAAIFIQAITLVPTATQRVTDPIIARSYAKKEYSTILKLLKDVIPKTLIISLFISLILVIFGNQLITIIFGAIFLPAYQPLIVLLIGYTIYSMFISIGSFYGSTGHIQVSYKMALISAAISILLNIIFIPKYGILGAAIATSTSLTLLTIMNFIIVRHFVKGFKTEDM